MLLAVYIGTEKFHDEQNERVKAQPADVITLIDMVNEQQSDHIGGQLSLFLSEFNDEALTILENWLQKDAERSCILAWPHPWVWLAASIQQSSRPKEAIWHWNYQSHLILNFYKCKERQVTLEGYLPGVSTQGRLPLVDQLPVSSTAAIYQLMAHYLTQEDRLFEQTYNDLEASSFQVAMWPLSATEILEKSLNDLNQEKKYSYQTQYELISAQKSNNVFTVQQQGTHSRNDIFQRKLKEIFQCILKKNSRLSVDKENKGVLEEDSEKDYSNYVSLQAKAYSMEKENAILIEQLMRVQEDLEKSILTNQSYRTDSQNKDKKIKWLRKKIKSHEEKIEEYKSLINNLK